MTPQPSGLHVSGLASGSQQAPPASATCSDSANRNQAKRTSDEVQFVSEKPVKKRKLEGPVPTIPNATTPPITPTVTSTAQTSQISNPSHPDGPAPCVPYGDVVDQGDNIRQPRNSMRTGAGDQALSEPSQPPAWDSLRGCSVPAMEKHFFPDNIWTAPATGPRSSPALSPKQLPKPEPTDETSSFLMEWEPVKAGADNHYMGGKPTTTNDVDSAPFPMQNLMNQLHSVHMPPAPAPDNKGVAPAPVPEHRDRVDDTQGNAAALCQQDTPGTHADKKQKMCPIEPADVSINTGGHGHQNTTPAALNSARVAASQPSQPPRTPKPPVSAPHNLPVTAPMTPGPSPTNGFATSGLVQQPTSAPHELQQQQQQQQQQQHYHHHHHAGADAQPYDNNPASPKGPCLKCLEKRMRQAAVINANGGVLPGAAPHALQAHPYGALFSPAWPPQVNFGPFQNQVPSPVSFGPLVQQQFVPGQPSNNPGQQQHQQPQQQQKQQQSPFNNMALMPTSQPGQSNGGSGNNSGTHFPAAFDKGHAAPTSNAGTRNAAPYKQQKQPKTAQRKQPDQSAQASTTTNKHIIVDVADTCLDIFPFEEVARRQNQPVKKVREIFDAIIQAPLLRCPTDKRRAGKLGTARVRGYNQAAKEYQAQQVNGGGGGGGQKQQGQGQGQEQVEGPSAWEVAQFMGPSNAMAGVLSEFTGSW